MKITIQIESDDDRTVTREVTNEDEVIALAERLGGEIADAMTPKPKQHGPACFQLGLDAVPTCTIEEIARDAQRLADALNVFVLFGLDNVSLRAVPGSPAQAMIDHHRANRANVERGPKVPPVVHLT